MKLKFKKEDLSLSIGIVMKAIPSQTTNEYLKTILISTSSGEIFFEGNDTELAIHTVVKGIIEEDGEICLEAKLLNDIIRSLEKTDGYIEISTEPNQMTTIKNEDDIFNIMGFNPENFIRLPYIEKNNYISISEFVLKEVVRQTSFSTAKSESNIIMGGELLEVKENKAKFTTLDGHRISIRNIELKDTYEDAKTIIPVKSLEEISKIIRSEVDKEVLIYFSKNHILFEFENTTVVSRVIEGEYFKIENMLSNDYETKFTINRNKFLGSIKKAMVLIKENEHKPLILDIKDNKMKLMVKSSIGNMDGKVDIEKAGSDIMIAFNPKFLVDALGAIDDENVDIYMTNPKSPCFIRDAEDTYKYLILPVNFIA